MVSPSAGDGRFYGIQREIARWHIRQHRLIGGSETSRITWPTSCDYGSAVCDNYVWVEAGKGKV